MTVLKSDSSTSQSDYITHIVPNTGQIALGVGDYTTNITYNVSNIHRGRISRPPSNARPAAVPVFVLQSVDHLSTASLPRDHPTIPGLYRWKVLVCQLCSVKCHARLASLATGLKLLLKNAVAE